jgi:hypothetical protein
VPPASALSTTTTMIQQSTFDFTSQAPAEIGETERLLSWLAGHPGFHTAKTIGDHLGLTDRQIRQAAEAADGLIISGPGSPGYCHLYHCEAGKIDHITSKLISQGKHMIRRGIRTKRRAHQLISPRVS